MALTFTTGMTQISDAESISGSPVNWAAYRIAGSGGAPAAALAPDIFKQGNNSVSTKAAGNNWDAGLLYDWYSTHSNTVLNMSTSGNEMLALWVNITTPSIMLTMRAGGGYIILQSSSETGTTAPTVYAKWYVAGSDSPTPGWFLFLLDTRKTPSLTNGGFSLSSVRRIGFGLKCIASIPVVKSDNLYVDLMSYGRPIYKVVGDGSAVASWASFLANSVSGVNGLISDLGGALNLSCGIQIGDSAQSATTTFSDATGTQIIFKRHVYDTSSAIADAVTYSDIYSLIGNGAAANKTSITFGGVVGSGDDRQGVLGGGIRTADITNLTWKVDFQTNVANLSAVNLYGLNLTGAKGGILLNNDAGATLTNIISCNFVNCGEIDPGTTGLGATLLSCSVIDPLGGTAANRGLLFPNASTQHHVKKINFITSGTPTTQHMCRLSSNSDYSLSFSGMKFFGDYTSGTLWHGENSGNSADVTLDCSDGASPSASQFEMTGSPQGTVVVSNPVVLTLTDIVAGSEVRIYDQANPPNELGTGVESLEGSTFTYNYTYVPGTQVDICIINNDYLYYRMENYALLAGNTSVPIKQIRDRQYQP